MKISGEAKERTEIENREGRESTSRVLENDVREPPEEEE